MNQQPMIGDRGMVHGPGGRHCVCCAEAPGKKRVIDRRRAKRAERQQWKKNVQQLRAFA